MWNFVALWCGFVAECDVLRDICVLLLENIGKNFKKYLEVRNNINTFAEILRGCFITNVKSKARELAENMLFYQWGGDDAHIFYFFSVDWKKNSNFVCLLGVMPSIHAGEGL